MKEKAGTVTYSLYPLEIMVLFSRYLLSHYGHDATVDKILQRVHVHLVPTLNPDSIAEPPSAKTKVDKCDSQINTKNANGIELDSSFAESGEYCEGKKQTNCST